MGTNILSVINRNRTSLPLLYGPGRPKGRLVLCMMVMGLSGSCVPNESEPVVTMPKVWASGPSMVLDLNRPPRDETDYYNQDENRIRLRGAVNEIVPFEFALHGPEEGATGLTVSVEALKSASNVIPPDAVQIYRHWPVTIDQYPNWYLRSIGRRGPREIPDALVPINARTHGQPFTIPSNTNLVFWVEIHIPFSARPGTYEGAIVVQETTGQSRRTPIVLQVRDVILPPEEAIPVLARVQLQPILAAHTKLDPENLRIVLGDPEAQRVLQDTFKLLHAHGLSPFTQELRPRFKQNLGGEILLDWADYDRFCSPLINGRTYQNNRAPWAWPLPIDLQQPDPSQYGGKDSTVYTAVLKKYLAAVAAHFKQKGWLDKTFVFFDLIRQPNPRAEDLEKVRQLAILTHLVDDQLSFATRAVPQSMAPFGWFEHKHEDLTSVIDIWATPARYQHGPTMSRLQTLGKRTWFVPDQPPYSGSLAVEAPPIHARSLAWQAFLQDHEAIFLDQVTNWPDDVFDRPIRARKKPTDGWLVYPGQWFGLDTPVPSVRLKHLQLGIQDYQRLKLLEKNGRKETAKLIAGSLIKATGTEAYGDNYQDGLFGRRVDDPAVWELAGRMLDDELHSLLNEGAAAGDGAERADWVRFLRQTRRIEAECESARLLTDNRPEHEGFLLTYEVAIRSEQRTPLEGELKFGPLPPGAAGISDVVRVGPIPEMGLAREKLIASCPKLPRTDLDGHSIQNLVFDSGAPEPIQIAATTSVVQVPTAPWPIKVDGNLDDWPPNEFNAAGDFRLITAHDGPGNERRKAESQTAGYLCQDQGILYIGIQAAAPPEARETTNATPLRNFVEYKDLMPVGEDLVEILIDPTNSGTQSGDLYHIVLKSTGNTVFERGVRMVPPIGKVQSWPGLPPRCEVSRTDRGWSAEIAIPVSTFGPDAAANPVWGFNLARLEPIRGEYSDWARAPRYCYDPKTLGNLVWPE